MKSHWWKGKRRFLHFVPATDQQSALKRESRARYSELSCGQDTARTSTGPSAVDNPIAVERGLSNRRAVAQSGVWSIVLQWSRFGLNAVVFLILARWLSLEEIGAFAVAFAPIEIIRTAQRSGFSETVVQGRSELGPFTDTVFWMSSAVGIVMSAVLVAISFALEPFTGSRDSGTYLAAMAAIPALIGVSTVPEGILRRRMEIRTLALRTTTSLAIAGGAALWLGYAGYGGWALTAFAITNAMLSTILVILLARWKPGGGFSVDQARAALPVLVSITGRELTASSTLPLLQLLIGAVLGAAAAGAFQIAQKFLSLVATFTLAPMRFAVLPVLVRAREDASRLRRVVVETAGLLSLVTAPVYFGLLAVAPTLLPLVVGAQNGTAATPVLQALLFVGGHLGIFALFSPVMTATGRARLAFSWSLRLFVLNIALAGALIWFSEVFVALGYSLLGYLAAPFALSALSRQLGVSAREMARAVFGPVAIALVMVLSILVFRRQFGEGMNDLLLLANEIALGGSIYITLSLLLSRSQVITARSLFVALLPKWFHA